MSNPIFNMFGNSNINPVVQKFMQFKNTYQGDAKQQVQQMLNSGQISQEQYNKAVEIAQQLQMLIK